MNNKQLIPAALALLFLLSIFFIYKGDSYANRDTEALIDLVNSYQKENEKLASALQAITRILDSQDAVLKGIQFSETIAEEHLQALISGHDIVHNELLQQLQKAATRPPAPIVVPPSPPPPKPSADNCSIATKHTIFIWDPPHWDRYYTSNYVDTIKKVSFAKCPVTCNFTTDEAEICDCKAILFEGNGVTRIDQLPIQKPRNQRWFFYTQEPRYGHRNDSHFLSFFDERIDYEPDGFAPMPYFRVSWKSFINIPVTEKNASAPVVAFISNCVEERLNYLTELAKHIQIDSYGACMHNKDPPPELESLDRFALKKKLSSSYKFYLAWENSELPDYVSEKLIQGFEATSLPIYKGAPNIDEYLPDQHSVIKVSDFESPKALAEYLHKLLEDDELYQSYFAWRSKPVDELQVPRSMRPRTCKYCQHDLWCRMCLRVHSLL